MNNLINLEKAYNVRGIDGYVNKYGKTVKSKLFLRGDGLSNLSKNDIQTLVDYGVGTIIDLRSASELKAEPNKFLNNENVKYYNLPLVPMKNGETQDLTQINLQDNAKESFPSFYIDMLENSKINIKKMFKIFAANLDKTTLYHCTAGKDRTGVTSMLLLGLAEVSNKDIISNYIVSYDNIIKSDIFKNIKKDDPALDLVYSNEEYLIPSLNHIKNKYGSCYKYLLSTGLRKKTLDKIKSALLDWYSNWRGLWITYIKLKMPII